MKAIKRIAPVLGFLVLALSPAHAQVFTNATKLIGRPLCKPGTPTADGVALVWSVSLGCWAVQASPGTGPTGPAGTNGVSVTVTVESPGVNCTYGGIKTVSVSGTNYICNGAPGSNGTNGSNGQSVTVTSEPPGANCTNGGEKLVSISGTAYVCNGTGGSGGGGTGAGEHPLSGTSVNFNCTSGTSSSVDTFAIAQLTGNTTGTMGTCTAGQTLNFLLQQASSGGPYNMTWPGSFAESCAVTPIAGAVTYAVYTWDGTTGHLQSCESPTSPTIFQEGTMPSGNPLSGQEYFQPDSTSGLTRVKNHAGNISQMIAELPSGSIPKAGGPNAAYTASAASDILAVLGIIPAANGGTGVANPTAHSILIGEGASPADLVALPIDNVLMGATGADPAPAPLPNCPDSGGNHLNYSTSTHTLTCGTTDSGGGVSLHTGGGDWIFGIPSYSPAGVGVSPTGVAHSGTVFAYINHMPTMKTVNYWITTAGSSGQGILFGVYSADLTTALCISTVGTGANVTGNGAAHSLTWASGANVSGGVCTIPIGDAVAMLATTDSTTLGLSSYNLPSGSGAYALQTINTARLAGYAASSNMSTGSGSSLAFASSLNTLTWTGLPNSNNFQLVLYAEN